MALSFTRKANMTAGVPDSGDVIYANDVNELQVALEAIAAGTQQIPLAGIEGALGSYGAVSAESTPSRSQSLRGKATTAYWAPSEVLAPEDFGGSGNGEFDNAGVFPSVIAAAKAEGATGPKGATIGFWRGEYVTSAPIVLPRTGSTPTNVVRLIGYGRRMSCIKMSPDFSQNRALVEWEDTALRTYNGLIQGLRFSLANIDGTKAIWHKKSGSGTAVSDYTGQWLQCDMIDLSFEGHNDFHEVFVDLEIGNRMARMVGLYGDPTRTVGSHAPYATALVRAAHQVGSTDPASGIDSVGLGFCELAEWISCVRRGGFSKAFVGRMYSSTWDVVFANGAMYEHGAGYDFRNCHRNSFRNLGGEGWGDEEQYRLENCFDNTFFGTQIGVPDLTEGMPYVIWQANTAYALNAEVTATALTGSTAAATRKFMKCVTAGTSGGTEPSWSDTTGATVNDGTVIWEVMTDTMGDGITLINSSRNRFQVRPATAGSPIFSDRTCLVVKSDANSHDNEFTDFDVRATAADAVGNEFSIAGSRNRISGLCVTGPIASTVRTPYAIGAADLVGDGSPEGNIVAGVGSTYKRMDGGTGTSYYVKESGSGNTGWVAK